MLSKVARITVHSFRFRGAAADFQKTSAQLLRLTAYREGVIYLDEEMDMALALNTIWHEAAHVAQQEILGATDEAQVRWIAVFVHIFLVNNPAILDCYRYGLEPSPFEDDDQDNK